MYVQDRIEKYPDEKCDFLIEWDPISGGLRTWPGRLHRECVHGSKGLGRGTMSDDVAVRSKVSQ